jgi:FtsZ-interacting cell division protein ZipA
MTNPTILIILCAIALAIVVIATLWRRRIKAAWEGPQPQVWSIRIPTDDPINDRFEIYFSKEKES